MLQIAPYIGAFILISISHNFMTFSTTIAAILALIILPIVVLLWVTESKEQRRTRQTKTARKLRAQNYTFREIAERIGKSETTARRYCKVCAA